MGYLNTALEMMFKKKNWQSQKQVIATVYGFYCKRKKIAACIQFEHCSCKTKEIIEIAFFVWQKWNRFLLMQIK